MNDKNIYYNSHQNFQLKKIKELKRLEKTCYNFKCILKNYMLNIGDISRHSRSYVNHISHTYLLVI